MLEEVTSRYHLFGWILLVTIFISAPAFAIDYETSWVGNKWGGGPRDPWFDNDSDWIQMRIERMGVGKSNGVCICTCYWDESGRDGGVYDTDAKFLVNILNRNPAGPSTANNNHIFAAPGGGEIRRFNYNGDHNGTLSGGVYAMRINPNQNQLYVSGNNQVRIYNPDTLQEYRTFSVSGAGAIAVENNDYFWVTQNNNSVRRYHRDNGDTGTVITGLGDTYEITFNPITNQLWVFDRRQDQQIFRIFDTNGNPAVDPNIGQDFFGVQGGVYVATTAAQTGVPTGKGEVHPLKFNYVTGCGFDMAGNLYVGSDGPRITKGNEGAGALIRKFDYQGNLVWEAPGLEFIDVADADPATDGIDVYTKHGHYVVDHSLPPGQDVIYKGFTLDPYRYPDDMRTMEGADNPRIYAPNKNEHIRGMSNAMIRRIEGQKIMYVGDQHSTGLLIYRFDDEIGVPAGRMTKTAKPGGEGYYWDDNSQQWLYGTSNDVTKWYIWRDLNGNGARETNEEDMSEYGDYFDGVWGWYVDSEASIWTPWKFRGIRKYACQGLDGHGNPIYSQTHDWWPNPGPFGTPYPISDPWYPDRMVTDYQTNAMVCRAMYLPGQDVMIVSGYTLDYPQSMACGGNCEWGMTGRAVYRYDNWSTRTDHPIPAGSETWMITLPYDNVTSFPSNDVTAIKSIDISEDYVFTCEFASSKVAVYDINTGQHQFDLTPGPEVGYNCGWNETPRGMQIFKRSDGQYLVFVSEESEAKVIMYRFQGPNSPDQPRSLQATPVSTSQIDLAWTDTSDIEIGFRIERRSDTGSFAEIATVGMLTGTGLTGSYSDTGLPVDTTYWYRVRADLDGSFSDYSNSASATTLLPPPAAPSNLVAVADVPLSATVNLSWTDNADNESSYIIERANGPVACHDAFVSIATIGAVAGTGSQGNYTNTGLLSQTTYTYRVLASNSGGSAASNEDDATTPFVPDPVWIDDADAAITYSGSWTPQTGWPGRYQNTLHESNESGASASFSFNGNSLTLYGDTRSWGGTAQLIFDGQTPGETVSFTGADADGVEIDTFSGLSCGYHDVQLVANGDGWTYIDAFVYIPCEITGPPDAPTDLVATPVAHDQIDLTWTDNSTNETGFKIERKTTSSFAEIATTSAGDTDYSDTNLVMATTYTYRVRATNAQGDSDYSNEDAATTLDPPDPAPPANLQVAAGDGYATLTWDPNTETNPPVLYYKILRSTTQSGPYNTVAVAFGGTNITDKNVYNESTYYYRIIAVDSWAHESQQSTEVEATPTPPQPPPAPELFAQSLPYSQGQSIATFLYWNYGGETSDSMEIERKIEPSGTFAFHSSTSAGQNFFDYGLDPGTTYTYRVRASNDVGYSQYSNEASATTPVMPRPDDPTNLVANAVSTSQIDLTWTDNSDNEDGFRIERKTTGNFAQIATVNMDVATYNDTDLHSYTETYTYRVIAHNAGGDSNYSNEDSATILYDPIVTTVDDADAAVTYTGTWSAQSGWSGRYMETIHESNDAAATAEFTFTGVQIELLADLQSWGGTIDVYIDDTLELQDASFNGGPDAYQEVIFTIDVPNGTHTVRIEKSGGDWIYLDAFRYTHY